ncbi:MAG TPA: phosphopyruvate hydratase [Candidatus Saccharimonadales bacterium]|nr:phosphopyruvate hydratase [Candidatus Saccharimonadales bacterium]
MAKITDVLGEVIHDSRGENTVQVTVTSDNGKVGSSAVPAGKSVGTFEAKTIDPVNAVEMIANEIRPKIIGRDPAEQESLDRFLIELDGTPDKRRLGANTVLGISMAASRVAAQELNLPLYRYLGGLSNRQGFTLPTPMMNVINGGKHADNNLDIQEFMIVPDRVSGYHNQLSAGKLIFSTLNQLIRGEATTVPIGDEGGYAPDLDTNEMALELLVNAIKKSNYRPWDEVSLALDVAASCLPATFEISPKHYLGMMNDFPIISIEDPFDEEDWKSWHDFKEEMDRTNSSTKKLMLVGDDLFATNPERLKKGIEEDVANAILIKLNQIGSVTETIQVVEMAQKAGYIVIISHRSGETLDDYIADLAVGLGAQFIKCGAPNDSHPERMAKYRRLLSIEQELLGYAK